MEICLHATLTRLALVLVSTSTDYTARVNVFLWYTATFTSYLHFTAHEYLHQFISQFLLSCPCCLQDLIPDLGSLPHRLSKPHFVPDHLQHRHFEVMKLVMDVDGLLAWGTQGHAG